MTANEELLDKLLEKIEKLNEVGIALSCEGDSERLLERILLIAKELTHADAGTLYLVEDNSLNFKILRNDSLRLRFGGTHAEAPPFPSVPLFIEGKANEKMVSAYAALHQVTVNIPDAYESKGFDFSGTRLFDKQTGYRSQAFLTVPMTNHENEVIGVLQLINAKEGGETRAFSLEEQHLLESLASQAAIALSNQALITDLQAMLEGFIQAIADAIDAKSEYTGNHCRRVPIVAMALARAVNRSEHPLFKNFSFTEQELYELEIAALLHDCGKVVTPVHVVDKASRLETIVDRVDWVETRFVVLKRELEVQALKKELECLREGKEEEVEKIRAQLIEDLRGIDEDAAFVRECNEAKTQMTEERQQRIHLIAGRAWTNLEGNLSSFLSEDEVKNLCIPRGTLTEEERQIIQDHVVQTQRILEKIPYPSYLTQVPEIAGGHHERLDGKGYPDGLTKEELSLQARILGIADIFEALTCTDRPYKRSMGVSRALDILREGSESGQIDPDLFQVFVDEKVFAEYGAEHLSVEQLDIK